MRTLPAAGAAAVAACIPLALVAAPASAGSHSGTATVSVLHAVPGLTVDVYANGDPLVPGFEPGTLTDAQQLPAGSYDLAVYPAGADAGSTEPAISADDVEVPAGVDVTVVAHLDAQGQPTLTPFVNDVSEVPAGQARLTVRHTAAAPAVDVRANGQVAFSALENPREASAVLPAGTISADVVPAGAGDPVIGPADLDLAAGTHSIVYAWGSLEDGNLALAAQSIDDLGGMPNGVPSGEAGLLTSSAPLWVAGASLMALLGAALSGRRLLAARSAARG